MSAYRTPDAPQPMGAYGAVEWGGIQPECKKCGLVSITGNKYISDVDLIRRRCISCEYSWYERPKVSG